ncbi:MAG: hypothetical protein K8S87_10825, partial [Planctomycetes bacterium]|nr:hypothetical protein [Planctomycetota bacterium]
SFVKFLLFLPSILILLVWFFCIFKYFRNVKKVKLTKPFAEPIGDYYESDVEKYKKDYTRLFLIIGTIAALLVIVMGDLAVSVISRRAFNSNRISLRLEAEPTLQAIASRFEKYIQKNKSENYKPSKLQTYKNAEWNSIFDCNLECFKPERNAHKKAQILINSPIIFSQILL